jgi:hypothetical protein
MISAKTSVVLWTLIVAAAVRIMPSNARGAEPTAFEVAKEGNRYIGEQSKDKVIQIRSDKSVASTVPNVWHVLYYDPTATFKAVEIEFGGGKMMSVKRPFRVLETITGNQPPLDLSKLKIDSDKAIKTAISEPVLDKLTVRATSAKLERGDAGLAVWKVRVWAAKLRNPNDQVDLGEVLISAEDGTVIKNELRIQRVD